MGLEDIVNKAKEVLTGDKADDLAAKAGEAKDQAAEKVATEADELIAKAKELISDERIDQIAEGIKKVTPDSIDSGVDMLADQAKKLND
ncbi:hypothetical protein [Timonella senegalensis]|jgi:hypothetical protein|uniref:hypothetical protein n=1 Tax=Timonella senegalensis TaxID=1465825 RepID=UPI00031AA526|nr:hypothetical protein [Timonella senegalensis]